MDRRIAGHVISSLTERCTVCHRSASDIMSAAAGASEGDEGVACVGRLNRVEMDEIMAESVRRARIADITIGIASSRGA